jgi:hypothetical protein
MVGRKFVALHVRVRFSSVTQNGQIPKWLKGLACKSSIIIGSNPILTSLINKENKVMKPRLSKEQKKQKMVVDMINKMFEIAGHPVTFDDVKDRKDSWYTDWTMTMEQNDEWKKWGKKYLMKELRMYAKMAEKEMSMISLMWGLKFSNFELNTVEDDI